MTRRILRMMVILVASLTIFLQSTNTTDPTRPSDVDQPRTIDLGGNHPNECPFSGISVANDSTDTYVQPRLGAFKQNINVDSQVGMFHKGVRCDGCGAHPITGLRYKSKVKDNYDLCSICFTAIGNETDYIRIDRPVHYRHPRPFRGVYWLGGPVTPVLRGCGIKTGRSKSKLDSCFILDVNVMDGTLMAPSTPFTKIWRMRNSGTLAWPRGTHLVWVGGDKFSDRVSVEVEVPGDCVPVEGELDIAVDFTAPELPGRYISYWRMVSPWGVKFGQRVWVLIQVEASLKDSSSDSFRGLNLNLPPESSRSNRASEIIDMNMRPTVDGNFQVPCNTCSVNEPTKLVADEQPKKEQEFNFPINDSLLVGHAAVEESFHAPLPFTGMPASSSSAISDKDAIELSLLKELEEMGFKQVDLNKEILRMNEYDLEQSVDDLCGAAEWDPILEELQEMGFGDEEMNKRLLKKNNGSIKRVVMDLLTGEKA
ncbi:protein NBR1-like [Melia azedarach]|uniref:Protein NBR1-like n=1 Tax=Melia azedarach TaxID=155640 RepID=A0ACC1XLS7_MELAZ|nr:protein NBR1-like [Melia azedarach]